MQITDALCGCHGAPADISLLDEWLTNRDVAFMQKPRERREQIVGTVSLLARSDIAGICNKALFLKPGIWWDGRYG